jgi:hypothetical protein
LRHFQHGKSFVEVEIIFFRSKFSGNSPAKETLTALLTIFSKNKKQKNLCTWLYRDRQQGRLLLQGRVFIGLEFYGGFTFPFFS